MSAWVMNAASWSESLFVGMLAFALRATVLLFAAWLTTRMLRRASAATRHLVWTGAIAGILALPVIGAVVPSFTVPVLTIDAAFDEPHTASVATLEAPIAAPAGPAPGGTAPFSSAPVVASTEIHAPSPAEAAPTTRSLAPSFSLTTVLVVAWLTIALLLIARLAVANARVSAWYRASLPVDDGSWLSRVRDLARRLGITRPVILLENGDTDVPVTWGIVYPVILIPSSAEAWDDEQREAVLTHELAHVKRFDALTQQLAQVALALLWFHPLVWHAVRRMRLEREHACDDFVLAAGARASRYADDLLGLARRLARPTAPAAAALAMARRSELEGRLLAILDPSTKRTAVRGARVALIGVAVMLLAAPLAAFRPGARVHEVSEATAIAETAQPPVAALPPSPPAAVAPEAKTKVQEVEAKLLDAREPRMLEALTQKLAAIAPSALASPSALALPRMLADTEPPRPVDVQTLIEVTRAAKRMSSDHERGQLLQLIAKRYVRSDELRDAYLDAVMTMSSDHERSTALIALLDRDSLPASAAAKVLRTAALMSSDMSKSMVLKRITPATFGDSTVQKAYVDILALMSSSVERAAAISALIKSPALNQAHHLALLRAASGITSSTEKANVLLLFLEKQGIADETVKRAFFKAAETLSSDMEYRRVMVAVMR